MRSPLHSAAGSPRLVALLAGVLGLVPPTTRAQTETTDARWIVVAAEISPAHAAAFDTARAAVRARDAAALAQAIDRVRTAGTADREPIRDLVHGLGGRVVRAFWCVHGLEVDLPSAAAADRVARSPLVASCERARRFSSHLGASTGAANSNADAANAAGATGRGATLALLDSGIDLGFPSPTPSPVWHPAFDAADADGSRIVAAFGPPGAPHAADDADGHGTSVAAVALARRWQGTPFGPTDDGFAPDAHVVSYRITNDGNGTVVLGDLLATWDRVLEDRLRYDIGVVNLSYAGSPEPTSADQIALDRAAYVFDLVVVTSAGNDGRSAEPALASSASCNGIAVGAVHGGSHEWWRDSSFGPLPGDDERTWPDLVAVGVGIRSAQHDTRSGATAPLNGTSWAAPAVAGSALLVRGARPDLDALTTKAILLNTAQDVRGTNPGRTRQHVGLGLVRADLAVDQARRGQHATGVLGLATPHVDVPVQVTAGQRYAATLAWPRVDLDAAAWDDLDLVVVDAATGRTVAAAESRRNLYERALFTAATNGTYLLRITSVDRSIDNLEWALTVGANVAGGAQPGSFERVGDGCASVREPLWSALEIPRFAVGRDGDTSTAAPFAIGQPCRVQHAYPGTEIPTGTRIERLEFRRDDRSYAFPDFAVDLEIRIGLTTKPPHALSTSFDANADTDPFTLVFAGRVDFAGTRERLASAAHYDFAIRLDTPFVAWTGPNAHLLIEYRVLGFPDGVWPQNVAFDADQDLGPRYGELLAVGNPLAATGQLRTRGLALRLVGVEGGVAPGARPRLDASVAPRPGRVSRLVLRDAPAGVPALLAQAPSERTPPLDLTSLGAPGCTLRATTDVVVPTWIAPTGHAWVDLAIPNLPTLSGTRLVHQFLVLDPAANAAGVLTSNLGVSRVGGS